jgi:hypothetical protein
MFSFINYLFYYIINLDNNFFILFNSILIKPLNLKLFSGSSNSFSDDNKFNNNKLNPYWVTGFTDAEGCFSIIITCIKKTL